MRRNLLAAFLGISSVTMCLNAQGQESNQLSTSDTASAQPFRDLGIAVPSSTSRGTVATRDGKGHDVILSWLFDIRGCYGLLVVDVTSGTSKVLDLPFTNPGRDSPFASILSKRNKFYSLFGSHFVEFDPATEAFTALKSNTRTAMSMTESDSGVIYAGTYPQGGLFSFDPSSGAYKDYGSVNTEGWDQYPRSIATDSSGWIYLGIGFTQTITLMVDPRSGKATVAARDGIEKTTDTVRHADGKVYAHNPAGTYYVLFDGARTGTVAAMPSSAGPAVSYIAGDQNLFHTAFPSGRVLDSFDPVSKTAVTTLNGTSTTIHFDCRTEGAILISVQGLPNGHVVGGSNFPFRNYDLDPSGVSPLVNRDAHGQWNTIGYNDDHVYVGGYVAGFLLDWNLSKPWVPTVAKNAASNPLLLTDSFIADRYGHEFIERPANLLVDGQTLVLAGTPNYGVTGGGLHFWKPAAAGSAAIDVAVKTEDDLPAQSTASMIALRGALSGLYLGGTTISPGSGGATLASQAELYLMNKDTRRVVWHAPVIPGVKTYLDLIQAEDGAIYGMTDASIFFGFDPSEKRVTFQRNLSRSFGAPMTGEELEIQRTLVYPPRLVSEPSSTAGLGPVT
jgi:hypothetical protein